MNWPLGPMDPEALKQQAESEKEILLCKGKFCSQILWGVAAVMSPIRICVWRNFLNLYTSFSDRVREDLMEEETEEGLE